MPFDGFRMKASGYGRECIADCVKFSALIAALRYTAAFAFFAGMGSISLFILNLPMKDIIAS
mgnify:CR=1 FL=1